MADNNVIDLVGKAQKPKPKPKPKPKKDGSNGGDAPINPSLRFAIYGIVDGAFYQFHKKADGYEKPIKLCDFVCQIIEEVTHDNDLEDQTLFKITLTRADGRVFSPVNVPATKFFNGSWVHEFYGIKLHVSTGVTIKEHLRSCVELYSKLNGDVPNRHVYRYTGWKKISGHWHYLTGTGAITKDGLCADVNVDLGGGNISRYGLPEPADRELIKANAANLLTDLLNICPSRKTIGVALLAAIARAPLGECSPIDFTLFFHGKSGSRKSAIASVALSFFGNFYQGTRGVFPAMWSDTAKALLVIGFMAKDSVLVVDEFKLGSSKIENDKLYAKAEHFIQYTGNIAGQSKLNADSSLKSGTAYNRSMTIATGEHLPKTGSLFGRMLVFDMVDGDVDLPTLSRLFRAGCKGELRACLPLISAG